MRLSVKKTYKIYIGGQFPRTESERTYPIRAAKGNELLANVCKGSRKDVRNAVTAARAAFDGWAKKTALNRGQILYRVAEIMDGRADQFVAELVSLGATPRAARIEVETAVDAWVHYAGWSDKYAPVLGSINPVAGPYYSFSVPEPTGVVGFVAPEEPALLGVVARLAPAIVSGNTAVVLASESKPLPAVTLAEVLATSDVPGGVVNIITGMKTELCPTLASHMDVNALDLGGVEPQKRKALEEAAAENVKRLVGRHREDGAPETSLWAIAEFLETKTVWHPMGA
jgi:acyl-CoA reductase-like NAD-dependent aldehyde dehydrogenase